MLGFHGPQQDVVDVVDELQHPLQLRLLSYQDDGVVRQQQIEEDLHAREWGHLEQQ